MAVNTSTTSQKGGWMPPPLGIFKVNVDGATSEEGEIQAWELSLEIHVV